MENSNKEKKSFLSAVLSTTKEFPPAVRYLGIASIVISVCVLPQLIIELPYAGFTVILLILLLGLIVFCKNPDTEKVKKLESENRGLLKNQIDIQQEHDNEINELKSQVQRAYEFQRQKLSYLNIKIKDALKNNQGEEAHLELSALAAEIEAFLLELENLTRAGETVKNLDNPNVLEKLAKKIDEL